MVFAHVGRDFKIRKQEHGPQIGNQFLRGIRFAAKALIKVSRQTGGVGRPVDELVRQRRAICFDILETLIGWYPNEVSGGRVEGAVPTMPDRGAGRSEDQELPYAGSRLRGSIYGDAMRLGDPVVMRLQLMRLRQDHP